METNRLTAAQIMRNKIIELQGAEFSMKWLNPNGATQVYNNLRRLVQLGEIEQLPGRKNVFKATNKIVHPVIKECLTTGLDGWRDAYPGYFSDSLLPKGKVTIVRRFI